MGSFSTGKEKKSPNTQYYSYNFMEFKDPMKHIHIKYPPSNRKLTIDRISEKNLLYLSFVHNTHNLFYEK